MAKKYSLKRKRVMLQCDTCELRFLRDQCQIDQAKVFGFDYSYCSKKCSNTSKRRRSAERLEVTCSGCKVTFTRKKSEVRKNKSGVMFCSKDCCAKNNKIIKDIKEKETRVKNNKILESWIKGKYNPEKLGDNKKCIFRKHLLDDCGRKCTECGWSKPNPKNNITYLHIDHIDGDRTNNRKNNLRVLCQNCHSLTPTYLHLNKKR